MTGLVSGYLSNDSTTGIVQRLSLASASHFWRSVFVVTYAIEFLCLSVAKLMVLDRMSEFATRQGVPTRRWVAGGWLVMTVVVLGNFVGLAGNIAAAVYGQMVVEAFMLSSESFAANNTQLGLQHLRSGNERSEYAAQVASVQSFCEVAVLLFILFAFAAVGVACARRFSPEVLSVGSAAVAEAGKRLRLQIVGTTVFVFVAFLVRSVYSTMNAVTYQLQDSSKTCPGQQGRCDETCVNVFTLMLRWMVHTPEFQPIIVLISSPLTLLVALWGMTPRLMLQLMKSREHGEDVSMHRHDSSTN